MFTEIMIHHTAPEIRKHGGVGNGATPSTVEEVDAAVNWLKGKFSEKYSVRDIPILPIQEM